MAIGGNVDPPPDATVSPYCTSLGTAARVGFSKYDIDRLAKRSTLVSAPFAVVSLGAYRGELRRAIHHMKFRNRRWIGARFGRHLARAVRATYGDWTPHVVTWAPTTARRVRLRGHDQSAVIAAALARSLHVRRARVLRRIDDRTQTGASRAQRRRGPQFVVNARAVRGRRVLIVDDVLTTGTTMSCARDALIAAGAVEVRCVVIAHVKAGIPARIG